MSHPLLVLDTATRTPVLALANSAGALIAQRAWTSRQRHGEELLERLDELLGETGSARDDFAAVVVSTGPGSFTGLRIGLATAKLIAYSLHIPLVGVSTTHALALAAWTDHDRAARFTVALPAGVADRYVHVVRVDRGEVHELDSPQLVAGDGALIEAANGAALVAVDLDEAQLPVAAVEAGRRAVAGLAGALAVLGTHRLASDQVSDPAALVPAYVALPRGLTAISGEIEWSVDRR
jgi:tRNA threonylcarbamoyladenosine biosynthesis protein TsaB